MRAKSSKASCLAIAHSGGPRLLVWSHLFPSVDNPYLGSFVRERMFRLNRYLPIVVMAPQPWFPFQRAIRLFLPNFRRPLPSHERQDGIDVHRPCFLSFPAIFKGFEGWLMARACMRLARRLTSDSGIFVIDAHFAYPDGYAASLVAQHLGLKCVITMRGTEVRHVKKRGTRKRIAKALRSADRVIAVSESLRRLAIDLGVPAESIVTIGNGVDSQQFRPLRKAESRLQLAIPVAAKVLITVGGLVERKGFHRVIELLPSLRQAFPMLYYLIVGGPGPEGDYSSALHDQVRRLGLTECVRFLGPLPPDGICQALSASDVFVLASRNEGWANVILEAMACGLPVIATDVGGNAEVISRAALGSIVPFGNKEALEEGIQRALAAEWDRDEIRSYAISNNWERRVEVLVKEFAKLKSGALSDGGSRKTFSPQ